MGVEEPELLDINNLYHAHEQGGALVKKIVSGILSDELDFMTKFLVFALSFSFVLEIIFLLTPRFLKVKIARVDGDKKFTGWVCLVLVIGTLLVKGQQLSTGKTAEEKLREAATERSFRLRQTFMLETHLYQLIIISSIWLVINIQMQLARK